MEQIHERVGALTLSDDLMLASSAPACMVLVTPIGSDVCDDEIVFHDHACVAPDSDCSALQSKGYGMTGTQVVVGDSPRDFPSAREQPH